MNETSTPRSSGEMQQEVLGGFADEMASFDIFGKKSLSSAQLR